MFSCHEAVLFYHASKNTYWSMSKWLHVGITLQNYSNFPLSGTTIWGNVDLWEKVLFMTEYWVVVSEAKAFMCNEHCWKKPRQIVFDEELKTICWGHVPTWVSSCTTLYCSFHTAILVPSSFLSALSFFSSGLQNVLMEFMEELSLDSLASS